MDHWHDRSRFPAARGGRKYIHVNLHTTRRAASPLWRAASLVLASAREASDRRDDRRCVRQSVLPSRACQSVNRASQEQETGFPPTANCRLTLHHRDPRMEGHLGTPFHRGLVVGCEAEVATAICAARGILWMRSTLDGRFDATTDNGKNGSCVSYVPPPRPGGSEAKYFVSPKLYIQDRALTGPF
jgi:hypothetical protein